MDMFVWSFHSSWAEKKIVMLGIARCGGFQAPHVSADSTVEWMHGVLQRKWWAEPDWLRWSQHLMHGGSMKWKATSTDSQHWCGWKEIWCQATAQTRFMVVPWPVGKQLWQQREGPSLKISRRGNSSSHQTSWLAQSFSSILVVTLVSNAMRFRFFCTCLRMVGNVESWIFRIFDDSCGSARAPDSRLQGFSTIGGWGSSTGWRGIAHCSSMDLLIKKRVSLWSMS